MLAFQSCNPSPNQQSDLQLINSQSSSYLLQALNQIPQQLQQKAQAIQQENQKLRNENQVLQSQVNHLENKQQELINEIHDLRQLIKRVYKEGEMSVQFLKNKNTILENNNDSLEKALKNLQANVQMFGQLKELSELMKQGNDF
ncbi:unnamed protein product (macronuclear) [Paramecium tetraurelia]|uniref:Uncharacterized protein n=1 Tax=Paramecium tetraurelia TaxID=5888 RepID=A0BBD8_PARTE|nr:uncharacterized protein GSPATT00000290001 [Paramecium tetraurelia]CAK55855.1 unnamed protein product [Paramecium tetraurelia]|eukprot:XP_001423253.1 hypothetical protein (macronuclear) [Paramecium tetraurelia strain d4-2]